MYNAEEREKAYQKRLQDAAKIINKRYGRLFAVRANAYKEGEELKYYCNCDCGNYCFRYGSDLVSGKANSCGCLEKDEEKQAKIDKKMNKINEIVGNKYGRLTVVKAEIFKSVQRRRYFCECACGSEGKWLYKNDLTSGRIISCGCVTRRNYMNGKLY